MSETPQTIDRRGAVVQALAAAQAAFPELKKTKTATVNGKGGANYSYSYADLADVLAAVRPVLAEHGLALVQRTVYDERGKLILRTELLHVLGGRIYSEVAIEQSPGAAQQFGGALTYMRRYALVTLLGVQADDDLDGQHVETAHRAPAPALPAWAAEAAKPRKAELIATLEPLIGKPRAIGFGQMLADSWGAMPDGAVAIAKALVGELHAELGEDLQLLANVAADRRASEAAQAEAGETPDPEPVEQPDEPAPEPEADGQLSPASLPMPDLDGLDAEAASAALREAGCICPDPLHEPFDGACPIAKHGIPF